MRAWSTFWRICNWGEWPRLRVWLMQLLVGPECIQKMEWVHVWSVNYVSSQGNNVIKTRMRSRWGAIANRHAKVFDPSAPSVPPLGHDPSNRMKILSNIFSIWYKNLWNWHGNRNLMIFDLLTSPQGHQFHHRMKILLDFCSTHHPRWFDMPHDQVFF